MVFKCKYEQKDAIRRIKGWLKKSIACVVYWCLLYLFPAKKQLKQPDHDFVVIFMGALGDFLVFCSYAKALVESGKRLTLVVKSNTGIAETAKITGLFSALIELDNQPVKRLKNIRVLRSIECDTVVCLPLGRHILPDVYANAIGANHRIMADTMQDCISKKLKNLVEKRATKIIPVTEIAETSRYEQFWKAIGINTENVIIPFHLLNQNPDCQKRRNSLAIFPGSGGNAEKRWPIEYFAEVIWKITKEKNFDAVYIMGTHSDYNLGEELFRKLSCIKGISNCCGKTRIGEAVNILKDCSLCLANDSGGAHLSMSCGVPTAVICGMWQPGRFFPNSKFPEWCKCITCCGWESFSCGKSSPDCKNHQRAAECVSQINVSDVISSLEKLLC